MPRGHGAKPAAVVRPAPEPRRRLTSLVESVPWSAEEFEGELVDRVRRSVTVEERSAGPPPATTREVPPAESQAAEPDDSHPADAADNAPQLRPTSQVAWP